MSLSVFAEPDVYLTGSFVKSDRKYIYVRKESGIVKVPRKYSLRSPKSYSKGDKLKLELPISQLMKANRKEIKREIAKSKKRSKSK